jgi:hypothetical protein
MIETDFKQVNKMVRFFALALALVSATVVMTLSSQAANAQITPAQQQALRSLVETGFTNSYPINPGPFARFFGVDLPVGRESPTFIQNVTQLAKGGL